MAFDPTLYGRGHVPLTPTRRAELQALSRARHGDRVTRMAKFQALPASFDCRIGVPLPIWDQGSCGSCYLVATVRTATCALIQSGFGKADNSFKLAAQYGMDRPRNFGGCGGGNGTEVIAWMIDHGWLAEIYTDLQGEVHRDYPAYEARSGSDRSRPGAMAWMKGATWGFVNNDGRPTIDEIKAALVNYGRLNIAIDAGGQFGNGTGTITSLGNSINHEINVSGYDDNKDGGSFLLENQWNTGWGVGGSRWCTYKAAAHIVDWFWVSSGVAPPPAVLDYVP